MRDRVEPEIKDGWDEMAIFGVTTAIIENGKVLLVKREDFPVWCLPGGMIEDCESIAQAAMREAREETGLEIELLHLVGVYSRPAWRNGGAHEMLFAARPIGGRLSGDPGETVDVRYFDPNDLPDTLLWWQRQPIADAMSEARGLSWSLDATWSFGDKTREEGRTLITQNPSLIPMLIDHICSYPQPEKETLEAGGH